MHSPLKRGAGPLVWNRGDTRIAYVVKVVRYVGKAWSSGYARRRSMSFSGVDVPERPDGRLDGCLRERGRGLLLIGSVGINVDAIGGGVVGHAEVHSLRNVPEFHEVVVVKGLDCHHGN